MEDPLGKMNERISKDMDKFDSRMGKIFDKISEGPPLPPLPGGNSKSGKESLFAPPAPPAPGDVVSDFKDTVPSPRATADEFKADIDKNMMDMKSSIEALPKKTLEESVAAVKMTGKAIGDLPKDLSKDTADGVLEFMKAPSGVLRTVTRAPGKILANANDIISVALDESLDLKGKSYKERAEKMRTLTDYLPLV